MECRPALRSTGLSRSATAAELLASASAALAAVDITSARLDAELLLAAACGLDRTRLAARLRESVAPAHRTAFAASIARRLTREPLQYLLGHQEFWSLDFVVTPAVLIPRPETECVVEAALTALRTRGTDSAPSLCDMGTGSGCIAVTLARELPRATVWGLDVLPAALGIAATNARRHGVRERVHLVATDLFAAVPELRVDAIVANPPYIASADLAGLQAEVTHEPRAALDGGATGLQIIGRLFAEAPARLNRNGVLVMEIGADQAATATALAAAAGWCDVSVRFDYAGLPRVLVAGR